MNQSGGFLSWKIGQIPNTALLYVGFCCCCSWPLVFQMHSFRTELKNVFPDIDDNMHWLYVLIGIIGLYKNDQQLTELERRYNISNPASSLPWWLPFALPFLWPMTIASQMKRLNALFEAIQK